MITATALKDRRMAARKAADRDLAEVESLKHSLARAREKRRPFYLKREEFLAVCRWKLGDQYSRHTGQLLESSSAKRIQRTTEMAFAFSDPDAEFALSGRIALLGLLPGVGIGLATAILALCYPKRYAPIEARLWAALFEEKRSTFELADYRRYLTRLAELAAELKDLDPKGSWTLQLVAYFARGAEETSSAPRATPTQ